MACAEMISGRTAASPVQCLEDELLQEKSIAAQRMEDEELVQGKFKPVQRAEDEELLQGKFEPVQRMDEDELLQGKFTGCQVAQREVTPNNTGMPNQLKAGIESLSGMSIDHVKVHYNSSKPAQLNAHAYAQGSEIHMAPGQEQHLPHEAWHVVQQAQGRVRPTVQMKAGVQVNDDAALEHEADVMGAKASSVTLHSAGAQNDGSTDSRTSGERSTQLHVVQAIADGTIGTVTIELASGKKYTGSGEIKDHTSNDPTYVDCFAGTWPSRLDIKSPPKGKGPISTISFSSPKGKFTFNRPSYFWHPGWVGPRATET